MKSNKTFDASLQIRLSYHASSTAIRPGPMELVVYFMEKGHDNQVSFKPKHLHFDMNGREGWIRWEAALPLEYQQR